MFWDILKKFAHSKVMAAAILAVICLFVVKFILIIYDKVIKKTKLDPTICKILRVALKSLLLFTTIIIVLSSLGVAVSSLVATLSVVGVAVSLAIQGFLSNVFGGIQIISNKPFQVGDFIEVEEDSGTVREVGLFYTKLDTPDKKLIQIPNSIISTSVITNYSSAVNRRIEINVSVSYDNDVQKVKSVLLKTLCDHPSTLRGEDLEPVAHVSAYNDSSIAFVARAWCKSGDYWTLYFDILDSLQQVFKENGIAMTYPHINVHMQ